MGVEKLQRDTESGLDWMWGDAESEKGQAVLGLWPG